MHIFIEYIIVLASSLFSIGTTNGIVTLSGSIDRETVSRYIVSISVSLLQLNPEIIMYS